MGVRSVGKPALQLTLAEVCDSEPGTLKNKVAQARLLVVHSTEIDDAGEANVGLATFDQTLRQIRGAWQKLYAAGVKQFVFTADHGFLLQDETTAIKPYGSKRDPSRRHVLASEPRAETGMVNVSLSALGYDGADGFLLLREDTAVFATGVSGATFVHGGNSLQERVIPVLVVGRKREANTGLSAYLIEAQPEEEAMGLSRLRLRVQLALQQTGSLGFVATAQLGVALRVPDRPDIQVLIKGTTRAQNRAGRLEVKLDEWAEVFFSLVGPRDERVRVELFHPDGVEQVTACRCEGWFQVVGGALPESAAAAPATSPATRWQDNFPDEGARKAFAHIAQLPEGLQGRAGKLLHQAGRKGDPRWQPSLPFQRFRHGARVVQRDEGKAGHPLGGHSRPRCRCDGQIGTDANGNQQLAPVDRIKGNLCNLAGHNAPVADRCLGVETINAACAHQHQVAGRLAPVGKPP